MAMADNIRAEPAMTTRAIGGYRNLRLTLPRLKSRASCLFPGKVPSGQRVFERFGLIENSVAGLGWLLGSLASICAAGVLHRAGPSCNGTRASVSNRPHLAFAFLQSARTRLAVSSSKKCILVGRIPHTGANPLFGSAGYRKNSLNATRSASYSASIANLEL
ncbi:hypothetical protein GGR53DRAFT_48307 [Hypoxylon sp. FL1150]|nr:hypothetical protein GGR53DRAFT_48307 [Hypoxylon sp. FL1150]